MSAVEAKRTLVKSPPEVWAKVSDPEVLADHLADLGPIQITRVEPETVVQWEGDRASGSVRIEAGGWGTKVILTAELAEAPAAPEPTEVAPEPVAEPEPEGVTDEIVDMRRIRQAPPEEEPVEEPEAAAPEVEEAPEPTEAPAEPAPAKQGFFARLFGRKRAAEPAPEPTATAEPATPAPLPEPEPTPEPAAPEPIALAEPDPEPDPEPITAAALPEPEPEPTPEPVDVAAALAILEAALDRLGSAHHRPFSRA